MAAANVVLAHFRMLFTDYMQLLKVGDEWTIVSKIYQMERK